MNLKLRTIPALLALAALTLTGCKDDTLVSDPGNESGNKYTGKMVNVVADLSLPTLNGYRSATEDEEGNQNFDKTESDGKYDDKQSGDDHEVGSDGENEVRSLLLVIADTKGNYVSHAVAGSLEQESGQNGNYFIKAQIKFADLEEAYKTGGVLDTKTEGSTDTPVKPTVKLYAFCNYTADILNRFDNISDDDRKGGWINWTGEVNEDAQWAGSKPSITNTIWSNRSFLMTNWSDDNTCQFPANIDDWDQYADPSNPFDLTSSKAIKVERVAARLDFADGSPDDTDANTYPIYTNVYRATDANEKSLNLFSIELTRMSLVNMSNEYYYLRRVSANGLNANSTLGGRELTTNWVVDTDADKKATVKGITPETAKNYFNFRLYADSAEEGEEYDYNSANWYVDNINTVLAGTEDNEDYSNTLNRDYHIWRYVTENTIPQAATGDPYSQQKTVQSTGIIFKGCIIAGEELDHDTGKKYTSEELRKALTASKNHFDPNDSKSSFEYNGVTYYGGTESDKQHFTYPVLYSYDNMLYAGIKDMVEASYEAGPGSPIYIAVNNILNNYVLGEADTDGKRTYTYSTTIGDDADVLDVEIAYNIYTVADGSSKLDELAQDQYKHLVLGFAEGETNFLGMAPAQGITIYIARDEKSDNPAKDGAGWGYYCYYFYWNRHNDNLKSGKMGQMEFATVRNNIYKLAVTEISALGHPRTVTNDPDPVKPEDPDEEPNRYITVEVEVLPWVVRLNDIKF